MAVAYVINLDSRTDRWDQIRKDWKNAFPLERVPAVEATPGWKGCSLSHIKVVEEAKARGEPYVLVWEDDCVPRNRHPVAIRAMWNEVMAKLAANQDKWDVVLGGATWANGTTVSENSELTTHHMRVFNLPRGFTTHWTLWNVNSVFDRLMAYKEVLDVQIDVFMYHQFRVKVVVPFLAEQRQGYSDIEGRAIDYSKMFDFAEAKYPARKLSQILRNTPATPSFTFIGR
jgi:hypothetical protein